VVRRRSTASVAMATAVSKPKVVSVPERSLSIVLGTAHPGGTLRRRAGPPLPGCPRPPGPPARPRAHLPEVLPDSEDVLAPSCRGWSGWVPSTRSAAQDPLLRLLGESGVVSAVTIPRHPCRCPGSASPGGRGCAPRRASPRSVRARSPTAGEDACRLQSHAPVEQGRDPQPQATARLSRFRGQPLLDPHRRRCRSSTWNPRLRAVGPPERRGATPHSIPAHHHREWDPPPCAPHLRRARAGSAPTAPQRRTMRIASAQRSPRPVPPRRVQAQVGGGLPSVPKWRRAHQACRRLPSAP
jgi:hypothetical protein